MVSWSIFTDESGTNEQYLCYGAILIPSSDVAGADAHLEAFCRQNGLNHEMSWKACSPNEIERYCDFAEQFWLLRHLGIPLEFRSIVIDTGRYPLINQKYDTLTREAGFYKFYHWFLARSIRIVAPQAKQFEIFLAPRSDQYAYHGDILAKTIGGELRADLGADINFPNVTRDPPKRHRCHQLADVLLGAVSYKFNDRPESHKVELYDTIAGHVGQDLDVDFTPEERPFNVWTWTRTGDHRWAKGATGIVGPARRRGK